MKTTRVAAVLCGALVIALSATPMASSSSSGSSSSGSSVSHDGWSNADEMAMHEMLEGSRGRREAWSVAPSLVVINNVLDYSQGNMTSGFAALDQTMSEKELAQLKSDLTNALYELTGGTYEAFKSIRVETVKRGSSVKVVRAGEIVVARYKGVRAKTGNIGYGGRLTHGASIVAASVVLDSQFDARSNQRALLRTHELGHALGFNHVDSRESIMNARVGATITDFDRAVIRTAYELDGLR